MTTKTSRYPELEKVLLCCVSLSGWAGISLEVMHFVGNRYSVVVATMPIIMLVTFAIYREPRSLNRKFDYFGLILMMIGVLFSILAGGVYLFWEFTKLLALVVQPGTQNPLLFSPDELLLFGAVFAVTAAAIAIWEHREGKEAAVEIFLFSVGILWFSFFIWFVIDLAVRGHHGL